MKSWLDCLSPLISDLSILQRGHGEINKCLVKSFGNESDYWSLALVFRVTWRKGKIILRIKFIIFLPTVHFFTLIHINSLDMWIILIYIKNETFFIYTRWSSRHEGLGCHAPMIKTFACHHHAVHPNDNALCCAMLWFGQCQFIHIPEDCFIGIGVI